MSDPANDWRTSLGDDQQYMTGDIQAVDLIVSQKLGFLDGNVVKYICRRHRKGQLRGDLRKIIWYAGKLIEVEGEVEDLEQVITILQAFLANKKEKTCNESE